MIIGNNIVGESKLTDLEILYQLLLSMNYDTDLLPNAIRVWLSNSLVTSMVVDGTDVVLIHCGLRISMADPRFEDKISDALKICSEYNIYCDGCPFKHKDSPLKRQ